MPVRIETLATGDEVVSGDVLDGNAAYLARHLRDAGYSVARQGAVPDDLKSIADALLEISARARLCVVSGGLGPTEDDLTAEAAARAAGLPLETHDPSLALLKERFARLGLRFTENNARSARMPKGCEVHVNPVGSAPGFALTIGGCRFFFLPGVPREYEALANAAVLPWVGENLRLAAGEAVALAELQTFGWPESHLAERFAGFEARFPAVRLGYRLKAPEVILKLTARGRDSAEARRSLEAPLEEARRMLGPTVVEPGSEGIPGAVHRLMTERRLTLSLAESCTGGRVARLLTSYAGSSAYFMGGVVAYADAVKRRLLGVPDGLFVAGGPGAVSAECAEAMAAGALERFGTDLAVSVTGIAGPGGATEGKPVGLVHFCLAERASGVRIALRRNFRGDRERVQATSAFVALEMVRRQVLGLAPLNGEMAESKA